MDFCTFSIIIATAVHTYNEHINNGNKGTKQDIRLNQFDLCTILFHVVLFYSLVFRQVMHKSLETENMDGSYLKNICFIPTETPLNFILNKLQISHCCIQIRAKLKLIYGYKKVHLNVLHTKYV